MLPYSNEGIANLLSVRVVLRVLDTEFPHVFSRQPLTILVNHIPPMPSNCLTLV